MKSNLVVILIGVPFLTSCSSSDSRIADQARELTTLVKASPESPELQTRFKALFREVAVRKDSWEFDSFITSGYEDFRINLADAIARGRPFVIITLAKDISGRGQRVAWTTYFRELAGKGVSLETFRISFDTATSGYRSDQSIKVDIPPYGVGSHEYWFSVDDPPATSASGVFKGRDWSGNPIELTMNIRFVN